MQNDDRKGVAPMMQDEKRTPASSFSRSTATAVSNESSRAGLLAAAPPTKSPISDIVRWMQVVTIHNVRLAARSSDIDAKRSAERKAESETLEQLINKQNKSNVQTRSVAKSAFLQQNRTQVLSRATERTYASQRYDIDAESIAETEIAKAVGTAAAADPVVTDWLLNKSMLIRRFIPAAYAVDRWRSTVPTTTTDDRIPAELRKTAVSETRKFLDEYKTIVLQSDMTIDAITTAVYFDNRLKNRLATFSQDLQINLLLPTEPDISKINIMTWINAEIESKLTADRKTSLANRAGQLIQQLITEDLRIATLRWTRRMDDLVDEYKSALTKLYQKTERILEPLTNLLQELNVVQVVIVVLNGNNLQVVPSTIDRIWNLSAERMLTSATESGKLPLIAIVVEQRGNTGRTTIYPPQESASRYVNQPAGPALGQQLRKLPQENANPDWMAVFAGTTTSSRMFTIVRRPLSIDDAAQTIVTLNRLPTDERQIVSISVTNGLKALAYIGWKSIDGWLKSVPQSTVAMIHAGTDFSKLKDLNDAGRYFLRMPIGDTNAVIPLPHLAKLRDAGQPVPKTDNKTGTTESKTLIRTSSSIIGYSKNSADITGFTDLAVRAGFAGANGIGLNRSYSVVTAGWSFWTAWSVAPLAVVPIWNPQSTYKTGDRIRFGGQIYQVVDGYKSMVPPPTARLPKPAASADERFELFPLVIYCVNAVGTGDDGAITMTAPRPFPSEKAEFNCVQVTIERTPVYRKKPDDESFLTDAEQDALKAFPKIAAAAADAQVGSKPTGLFGDIGYIAGEKGCGKLIVATGVAVGPVLVNLAKLLTSAYDVDFVTLQDAASTYCSYFNHPAAARFFFLRVANVFKEGLPWYGRFGFLPVRLADAISFVRDVLLALPWIVIRDAMIDVIEDFDNGKNPITESLRRAVEGVNGVGITICAANRPTNTGFDRSMQTCANDLTVTAGQVLVPASRIVCNSWTALLRGIFGTVESTIAFLRKLDGNPTVRQNDWLLAHDDEDEQAAAAESIVALFVGVTNNLLIRRFSEDQYLELSEFLH